MTSLAPDIHYRVTFGRVVRSEWTKLRSLRSTWLTLVATALLVTGFSVLFGWVYANQIDAGEIEPSAAEAVDVAFLAMDLPALVVGILGVLQMSGENGTGSIRATLTAVPRRLPVLWAKALVLLAVSAPLMGAVVVTSFVASHTFAGSDGASLGDPGVPRAIIGVTGYIVAMGLLGLAFGTMLRNSAAAITTFVVVLLVAPSLLITTPDIVQDQIGPYLPVLAAQAMYAADDTGGGPEMLSPGMGAVVLSFWIVAALAAGAVVLRRRDA